MKNLSIYKEVSSQPAIKRDLSVAVNHKLTIEMLTENIMNNNMLNKDWIEEIAIINETAYENLPSIAIERLGMKKNQKNILLRITLRSMTETLRHEQVNVLYEEIYHLIHENKKGYV